MFKRYVLLEEQAPIKQ